MLEERRAKAHLKTLHYERVIARLYNRKVRPRLVGMGDLVFKKAEASDPRHSRRKLAPRWEGPYRVVRAIRDGTYTLATMDGKILPRT
ncbi:hypothetical protein BHE74_00035696 [Ensete ventricosum]|uniref:Uncharacterized protein n=1 Tax=Ensete ventricosum TaxID=4639 RepID=A0A445M8Q8_ENSVE|nr:hypothetical protein BHE74_00035696 [Ensete ventricosum]RZR70632.1 hypothetical protein BHM03_00000893 [Ensete ventricosum]